MLGDLPSKFANALFSKARLVVLKADDALFIEGDEGDGCYRVEEGLLKASVEAPNGNERILAIFGPGAVIGELARSMEVCVPHRLLHCATPSSVS